ncbi:AFR073Cp [Eremothecium gossypii ATCC 10895]|uniref:AFR073Cp n=1 Tax=Eremothecium gossypii (strain ATCC 10895 / CBS 109.51 / FGSC 9923 / NRRL Y-1056) TaxID=284811 RepID=Q754J9_EREGS|nr:AFR073Cp [Eremothecium gossypii ATCC 10895]AAS53444.1 AFR073Cp [Eremothecium gossypii ATCC 10895]AEY97756.1 FAFR073Cp [Eremothecium gossypii FDAG1]
MSSLPRSMQDLREVQSKPRVPLVIRRLFKSPRNLDFEAAMWEMVHLIFKPRKAFRSAYYQRQIKHRLSRDDPSFFILQVILLIATSLTWSIGYGHTFSGFLKMMINMILVDFFLLGFTMATFFWVLLNRPQLKFRSAQDSTVEWAYCFDIHCDAFLIIWVLLYFLQFLLLPVINLHRWIGLFVGNTLYCAAIGYYFVLTFYGYSQLSFLKNVNFILLPSLFCVILYLVSLFGIDLSNYLSFSRY